MKARTVRVSTTGSMEVYSDVDFDIVDNCLYMMQEERAIGQGVIKVKRTIIPLRLILEIYAESDPR